MLDEVAGTPVFTGERAHAGYPAEPHGDVADRCGEPCRVRCG